RRPLKSKWRAKIMKKRKTNEKMTKKRKKKQLKKSKKQKNKSAKLKRRNTRKKRKSKKNRRKGRRKKKKSRRKKRSSKRNKNLKNKRNPKTMMKIDCQAREHAQVFSVLFYLKYIFGYRLVPLIKSQISRLKCDLAEQPQYPQTLKKPEVMSILWFFICLFMVRI